MKDRDNLREFIERNRDAFETEKAPLHSWEVIVKALKTPGNRTYVKWVWVVIVVLIVALAGWYLVETQLNDEPALPDLEYAMFPEYFEAESYYMTQVSERRNELKRIYEDATLEKDLGLLDEIDRELRRELKDAQGPYKEVVLNALIQNHQTKLALLQKVLDEVKDKHDSKSIYHEF